MLLQRFQQHIKEAFHLHPNNNKLVIAVSGGVDSIVLTDLFFKSGFDFIIAHCNFQLRAEESERDEAFVKSLEEKYQKKVLIKKFDTATYANERKLSIQEAARELRYKWFAELVNSQWSIVNKDNYGTEINISTIDDSQFTNKYSPFTIHYSLLTTAHHANDNIETLLMQFFRGTGIHGLTGIPAVDRERKIIRPLLFATREEILSYAKENNLSWVEDSSNASEKYTRNFFRLQLLPEIKKVFPAVEENLLQNIVRFKDAEKLYQQSIALHQQKLIEQKGNEWHIPILKLTQTESMDAVLWEIIKAFSFNAAQLTEIKKLPDADNGSYVASITHRIIRNRNWLIIAPLETETAQHILIEKKDRKIIFQNGYLHIKHLTGKQQPVTSNHIAMLDAADIKFPLLLRPWKQGDYFYPLGMQKKKKLSRFFIDSKLSKTDKEKVWVIESNKKILWVIGYRIDDRFKITAATKEILEIKLINKTS